MGALVRIGLVLAVFYIAGRTMYQGRWRAHRLRMLHVLGTFCVVMVVSALVMLALMALSVTVEVALLSLDESVPELLVSPSGRLNGPNVLVYILLLIFLTAFIHYGLQRVALLPANINLVMQPLLVSSWVLVVIERFARKSR